MQFRVYRIFAAIILLCFSGELRSMCSSSRWQMLKSCVYNLGQKAVASKDFVNTGGQEIVNKSVNKACMTDGFIHFLDICGDKICNHPVATVAAIASVGFLGACVFRRTLGSNLAEFAADLNFHWLLRAGVFLGANINARSYGRHNNKTILELAAVHNNVQSIDFLVQSGGIINTDRYHRPLEIATMNGNISVVRYLVEHGATINRATDCLSLFEANRLNYIDIAEYLVMHGANVNYGGRFIQRLLRRAIERSNLEVVQFLVSHGAQVNEYDYWAEETLLSFAAQKGNLAVVRYLVEHGARVANEATVANTHGFHDVANYLESIVRERRAQEMAAEQARLEQLEVQERARRARQLELQRLQDEHVLREQLEAQARENEAQERARQTRELELQRLQEERALRERLESQARITIERLFSNFQRMQAELEKYGLDNFSSERSKLHDGDQRLDITSQLLTQEDITAEQLNILKVQIAKDIFCILYIQTLNNLSLCDGLEIRYNAKKVADIYDVIIQKEYAMYGQDIMKHSIPELQEMNVQMERELAKSNDRLRALRESVAEQEKIIIKKKEELDDLKLFQVGMSQALPLRGQLGSMLSNYSCNLELDKQNHFKRHIEIFIEEMRVEELSLHQSLVLAEIGLNKFEKKCAKKTTVELAEEKEHVQRFKEGAIRVVRDEKILFALLYKLQISDCERMLQIVRAEQEKRRTSFKKEGVSECLICSASIDEKDFIRLSCNHAYCAECLMSIVDIAIKDKSTKTLRCPHSDCKQRPLNEQDITAIAGINSFAVTSYQDIAKQEWLRMQPGARQCRTPDCKFVFINENNSLQTIQCPQCQKRYCANCLFRHGWNIMTCAQAKVDYEQSSDHVLANRASEQWKIAHTKQCPRCKASIERSAGCNHMTCKNCSYEFCWLCFKKWGGYNESGHRCPTFGDV